MTWVQALSPFFPLSHPHAPPRELALRLSKILFLPQENKIHIFKPPCNFLLIIIIDKSIFAQTSQSVRAGNDVIDILTSEDMENTPLESRM